MSNYMQYVESQEGERLGSCILKSGVVKYKGCLGEISTYECGSATLRYHDTWKGRTTHRLGWLLTSCFLIRT